MVSRRTALLLCLLSMCWLPSLQAAPVDGVPGDYRESKLAGEKFQRAALPEWVKEIAIPAAKPTAEPSVVLLADTQFRWVDKASEVFVHRATRANEASALQSLGQLGIDFNPEYQTVKLHALRILRDGTAIDKLAGTKIRFLERELGLENSIYTGMVTALIVLDDVRVGDTVEISYSTSGRNPVMGDKIADEASWDQLVPIQQRRISVLAPSSRKIRYRFIGGTDRTNQVAPRETRTGAQNEMVFEQFDIKPLRPEGAYAPWYHPAAWVQFSEYENWNEVAKWAAGLFVTPQPKSAEFERIVAGMKALEDPAKRVMAALDFVQTEIRYTSVSLGENSHRPAAPDEVIKRRYGDCKDKSLLLVSLLRAAGISAEPVLASLQYRQGFDKWLPSPNTFDHAIVNVKLNGMDYWLDATAFQQASGLSTLGRLHGLSEVLVADANVYGLSRIALPPAEQYENDIRQVVRLANFEEAAELESTQTLNGLSAEYFRRVFAEVPKDTLQKSFLDEMRRVYPAAEWASDIEVQDDRDANRLVIRSRYKLAKFATRNGEGWTMFHRPLNIGSFFALPESTKRRAPYAISYPLNAKFHFEVRLPEGVSLLSNDKAKVVRNDYFSMKQTRREKGNIAEADYELATFKPEVPASDVEEFSADLRKVRDEFRTTLYVGDDEIRKSTYAKLSTEDAFAALQKERMKQKAERISSAIDKGKLSGDDLAFAYSERASAKLVMGDSAGARTDIERALKISPDHEESHTVNGEIYFHDAEFRKSLESYTKALSMGADPADIYYRRAINHVFLAHYKEALADLQKAIDVDTDEERVPYHLLWYSVASARSGQPVPLPLQERMKKAATGHWPRPLLGMFNGALSPSEVLAALNAKNGDERLLNSCEAYFFIGEYHLAKGDMASARKAFEESRKTSAILYIEYDASGHELKRLAAN